MIRWLFTALPFALLASIASVDAAALLSAGDVMDRAEQRFRALDDYECVIECEARAGKRVEKGTYRVWFRQPNLLRVRVLQGKRKGCEVAVDANGQIRGREGGLLKPFVTRLRPDDRRLKSVRGKPFTEFDFGSFYRRYNALLGQPGTSASLVAAGGPDSPHAVALTFTDDGKKTREVYRIDADRWTLSGGQIFEDGALVEQFTVRDIKFDTGLSEKWFRL